MKYKALIFSECVKQELLCHTSSVLCRSRRAEICMGGTAEKQLLIWNQVASNTGLLQCIQHNVC